MTAHRCPTCGSPLTYTASESRMPHLTWCLWAPPPKPPVITLGEPAPDTDHTPDTETGDH